MYIYVHIHAVITFLYDLFDSQCFIASSFLSSYLLQGFIEPPTVIFCELQTINLKKNVILRIRRKNE